MQRTQNYNLCQWAAEDRILRSDFNADNQKIDAALAALQNAVAATATKYHIGSYIGNYDGSTQTRTITLPFTPKILLLCGYWNGAAPSPQLVILFSGMEFAIGNGGSCQMNHGDIALGDSSFTINGSGHNFNGYAEAYLAIG